MGSDNRNKLEPKRGVPGGLFFFLVTAILVILMVQNLSSNQGGKIAFSHQVEHLVNLDLIEPEDSQKVALNDNLVTFSGKFRDRQTEEGKSRYQYLELLSAHEELAAKKSGELLSLKDLQLSVASAADWFLHLSGLPIPASGYWVVGPSYDVEGRSNVVVIKDLSLSPVVSLADLQKESLALTKDKIDSFGGELQQLIVGFRSSNLGVGDDLLKKELRDISTDFDAASSLGFAEKLESYRTLLSRLNGVSATLNQKVDNVRLSQLRSVRGYLSAITAYGETSSALQTNTAQLDKARESVADVTWYFNNKELTTKSLEKQDPEAFANWFAAAKKEWANFSTAHGSYFKAPDQPRNLVLDKTFKSEEPAPNYIGYLFTFFPVLLVIFLLYFVFSKQMKGMGAGGAMNFGKSPAKLLTKDRNKITFKDVAGCDEAKEELQEIVDFLKDPGKFTALGARIPKGVLCIGAPGTGKTLIAKAVAGEADRPFFFISGSDFVEMFVGVGASRIRDMFSEARKSAPCIIFMDEIDAVGRHRGAGMGGGHDEREQTLNQLLVEMDGFDPTEGIILIAATNRPDVLDKALLRPGRFDRRIVIDLPDLKGRFEILKVHARKIKMDSSVDLMDIARGTPGASGADLGNILNEAALLAARRGRSAVTSQEAKEAMDKVRYGKERRSLQVDEQEKKTTAYHESGHAVIGLVVKHSDPVDKVTIIPRGLSLGATHFMPKKNRLSYWKNELYDQLAVLMGGRVAEELFVGDVSSGAQMDFSQATRLARSMVCEWGMIEELGVVAYDERSESGMYLGGSAMRDRVYSDETARAIDIAVRKLLEDAHKKAIEILQANRDKVQLMTDMLIEFETLDRDDVAEIMNGSWDVQKKKDRLKAAEELQKKSPSIPAPPPAPNFSIAPGSV